MVEVPVLGMGDGPITKIKNLKGTSLLFAIEGPKKPCILVPAVKQLGLACRSLANVLPRKIAANIERVAQRTNSYGEAVQNGSVGSAVVADATGVVPPDSPC